MALDPYDNDVYDAVQRVITAAQIPVNGDDVDARLQRLQPAITDAIANVAALPAGHSYFVHVTATPPPPYWSWDVVVRDENDAQIWYGQGYINPEG